VLAAWHSARDPDTQTDTLPAVAARVVANPAGAPATTPASPTPPERLGREAAARMGAALEAARRAGLLDSRRVPRVAGATDRPADAETAPRVPVTRMRLDLLEASGTLRRSDGALAVAGVEHTPYRLWKAGRPVLNRRGRVHERGGEPFGVAGRTSIPPLAEGDFVLSRDEAIARARAVTGTRALRAAPRSEQGWYALPGATIPAWRVNLPSRVPLASWQIILDARTGEVVSQVDRLHSVEGTGFVFDPNPAEAAAPSNVPLPELDGGGFLAGSFVRVIDDRALAAFAQNLTFSFPPGDPRAVQTAVYRGLTITALLAVAHGFPAFPAQLVAFTNLADPRTGGELNNAFYDPLLQAFGFGNGDEVVLANLGLDLDVAAHEMGHHFFEVLVTPDVFTGEDPVLAMSEGVADTFSGQVGGDAEIGESTVPGFPFLRTLKNKRSYPDGFDPDPHLTGLIYGGANWNLRKTLKPDGLTETLIAALPFLPPDAVETEYRDAMLEGDRAVSGGRFAKKIRKTFAKRGFDSVEIPPEFQGQVLDGMPEMGMLADGEVHFWNFAEFPDSTRIDFQLSGTGDADLIVASELFDPNDFRTFAVSERPFTTSESIVLTPTSLPSVHDGDFWGIGVFDFPDGQPSSYTLQVDSVLPVDGVAVDGPPVQGDITMVGEVDLLLFSGSAGQVVSVEVRDLDDTLDPLVVVFDAANGDFLAFDDDGGPGLDAFLQGVALPAGGRYGLAVLSLIADVDPVFGTGAYEVSVRTCTNTGPDADGDGQVDACDDDDDDDTFDDDEDSAPFDAALCADLDADTCDDCTNGSWDFLNDGPDLDRDGSCDAGDTDDDNDGCPDTADPAPATPSGDPDLDFLGADCDNCPDVPNPGQEDGFGDARGDACAACTRLAWTDPPTQPPDQNPAGSRIGLTKINKPGKAVLRARGSFNPAASADPSATGVFVHLSDADGALLSWNVPPAATVGCDPRDGWSTRSKRGDTVWTYANRSNALPAAACAAGSAAGLRSLTLTQEVDRIAYDVRAKNVSLPRTPADPFRFFQLDLVLENQLGVGVGGPAGDAGWCAESVLFVSSPSSVCTLSDRKGAVSSVKCGPPGGKKGRKP
jgi:hypothetical protein